MNAKDLRTILLAEDNAADAEMAIDALREAKLANPVVHVEDGVEALDYLHARGAYAGRAAGDVAVVLLDLKMPRLDGRAGRTLHLREGQRRRLRHALCP